MSYSYSTLSDPPGTRWLRNARQQITPEQQAAIQRVSDQWPTLGQWNWAIANPQGERWHLLFSPPETDQWRMGPAYYDLGDALSAINNYRVDPWSIYGQ